MFSRTFEDSEFPAQNFTLDLVSEAISFGFKPVLIYTDISKGIGKAPLENDWIQKYSKLTYNDFVRLTKHRSYDNIGILCGSYSEVIIIDVDVQDNGVENWTQLCHQNGVNDIQSFDTPTVLSGSLGYHYYFKYSNEFENIKSKMIPGVDILSTGKQVVYPGSVYPGCVPIDKNKPHKCGSNNFKNCLFRDNQYEWIKSPKEVDIKPIPDWLIKYIVKENRKEIVNKGIEIQVDEYTLIKECLKTLKKKADPYNEWIEVVWCIRALGFPKDIAHYFSQFSHKYDPESVDDIWDRYIENRVTWNWGSIRNWLKETLNEVQYHSFCQDHFKTIEDEFRLYEGDYGLANIFSEMNKHSLVIVNEEGTGFLFNAEKKIWEEFSSTYLSNLISKELLPVVNKYLKLHEEKIKGLKDKNLEEIYKSKLKELTGVKKYILSTRGCKQIFVKVMFNLLDKNFYSKLDNDSVHLPIKNCKVVNLKDGTIRDRVFNDYFTFECPVNYIQYPNEDGKKIVYDYLKGICKNDTDYTDWMIKFLGYLLTRETSDRSLYILWGKGMNGKSKLLELLEAILGKFYTSCSSDVLIKNDRKGGATPELIPLMYARVAVLSETGEEDKLNSERIKKLTGDDLISARKLFQEEITFKPKVKLLLITNKKPLFDAQDKAMTDRIKLLPFLASFENNFKNREYVESIKRDYLDHFFSMIVDGCVEWWKDKDLVLPQIAQEATKEYQKENDSISRWIDECCEVWDKDKALKKEEFKEQPSVLFESYNEWCLSNSIKNETKQKFGDIITKLFGDKVYLTVEKKRFWFYIGLRLN